MIHLEIHRPVGLERLAMSNGTHRSQRFALAASNERNRLLQKRQRVAVKREALQERLEALDAEIEAMDAEIVAIEAFVDGPGHEQGGEVRRADADARRKISGGAIRAVAVPLLLRERGPGPIHYSDWVDLLSAEGLEVAGKRPEAVFLSQVSRSPLVRATTKAGYYEIDLDAPDRLEDELRRQKTRLATAMIDDPHDLRGSEERREAQRELQLSISRIERALAEARTALEGFEADGASEAEAA
jgi:hypothetical protein